MLGLLLINTLPGADNFTTQNLSGRFITNGVRFPMASLQMTRGSIRLRGKPANLQDVFIHPAQFPFFPDSTQIQCIINVFHRVALDQYQISSETRLDQSTISELESLRVQVGRSS